MKERGRYEEDGLIEDSSDHWEYIPYRLCFKQGASLGFSIPSDIGRHLGLKKGDRVDVAIRKHQHVERRQKNE